MKGWKSTRKDVDRGTLDRHHFLLGCLNEDHGLHVYKREGFCDLGAKLY